MKKQKELNKIFQSTPSVGRATDLEMYHILGVPFQSTPSVGRATGVGNHRAHESFISIHALRGEGDRTGKT